MPVQPAQIELIGDSVAIRWDDGLETFYPMEVLRQVSPSAENRGEPDLFGNIMGGSAGANYRGVRVEGWDRVGGYACRFFFSDGHSSGIYTDRLMRELWEELEARRDEA